MTRLRQCFLCTSCHLEYLHVTTISQLKSSVFEDSHTIEKTKDLYDNRLGIYNLMGDDNLCGTCGARRASDCDGMKFENV